MGRALLVAAVSVLAAGVAPAADWSLSVGGGASIPAGTGAVQEGIVTGASASAAVGIDLGRGFEVLGRFAATWFPRDDDGVVRKAAIEQRPLRLLAVTGGELTRIDGSVDLRFAPSQGEPHTSVHPYALASLGAAHLDLEPAEIRYAYAGHTWPADVAGAVGTHLAVAAGAGMRVDLGQRFGILCEGRYEIVFQDEEDFHSIPLRIEIRLH